LRNIRLFRNTRTHERNTYISSCSNAGFIPLWKKRFLDSHGRLLWTAAGGGDFPRGILSNLESVNANGVSTWNGIFPVTLVGVLLTDPGEMLDSTPNFLTWNSGANAFNLGGQWQVLCNPSAAVTGRRGMLDGAELRQPAVGTA